MAMSMSMLIEITCTTSHRIFNLSLSTLGKNARHALMPVKFGHSGTTETNTQIHKYKYTQNKCKTFSHASEILTLKSENQANRTDFLVFI